MPLTQIPLLKKVMRIINMMAQLSLVKQGNVLVPNKHYKSQVNKQNLICLSSQWNGRRSIYVEFKSRREGIARREHYEKK